MPARLSILLVFVALIAAVAGCGGGGSSSTVEVNSGEPPQGPEIEKASFIQEADAICSDYQARVRPIKAELEELEKVAEPESPENEKKLGEGLNEAATAAETQLESLRELEVPAGDEAMIGKLFATAEEGDTLVGESATALEEGDTQTFGELAKESEAIGGRATKMAKSYGLKVCGKAP